MATFKAELTNRRADGTYNVRIRVTHNRTVRRFSTHLYVSEDEVTRGLKIKNLLVLKQSEALIDQCRDFCNNLGFQMVNLSADELVDKIRNHLSGGEVFRLDFIDYIRKKADGMKKGSGDSYKNTANALCRYLNRDTLDISEINTAFLRDFEHLLETEPSQRGNNRKEESETVRPKGGRAVSKYLACVRAIHNLAKLEYNDEDRKLIRIPYSPFKHFKIKPQPQTRKRALPVELIQKIIDIPYEKEITGGRRSRFNLAKDCFILSFALVGMNSADMYHAGRPKEGVIRYDRRKTTDRRTDGAEMHVKAEYCVQELIDKYQDDKRLFCFHRHYADHTTFNAAINKGLKKIGGIIGVEDLEFYAARHSWATIARSATVGIDKATVHEALNHVDNEMKVTDIYIDRDWSIIWEANKKVLGLFDWSELELMYLI